ncbi:MAG: hypothetical protein IJL61_08090 [Bacteroidales bacterium]|nr:hypothetical protein [Bacteroidales bacterium]
MNLRRTILISSAVAVSLMTSCRGTKVSYDSRYDPIADVGQYRYEALSELPPYYADLNTSDLYERILAASISGLGARAVEEGRSDTGFWIPCGHDNLAVYKAVLKSLADNGCKKIGGVGARELALARKMDIGGHEVDLGNVCDGYILTDMEKNPESAAVATTASHVFRGLIVDRRDKAAFDKAGYRMLYDASEKTASDAYEEFMDKCTTKGFTVMPAYTYEGKDYAIQTGQFFMNMYHQPGRPETGDHWDIFEKCCSRMEPNSSVYGWEWSSLHDERAINGATSKYGLNTAVNDWSYNYPLTTAAYWKRQKSDLATVLDPKTIDYSKKKKFVSFFMTDGDNTQWMMAGFVGDYLLHPDASSTKSAFGINTTLTPQISPEAYATILSSQPEGCTFVEVQGGGVIYSDSFAEGTGNRPEALKERARQTAAWMRQHRVKVLGLMAKDDCCSAESQECYKTMIEANDQLVGLIALQYTPYAGGKGEIFWFRNTAGYDIPVVTVKLSVWNTNPPYENVEGSPAFVARRLGEESKNPDFNLVAVHVWSRFTDAGPDCDEAAELPAAGGVYASGAARLCASHLDDSFEVVSLEEMLWQLRMRERPAQTKRYLRGLK